MEDEVTLGAHQAKVLRPHYGGNCTPCTPCTRNRRCSSVGYTSHKSAHLTTSIFYFQDSIFILDTESAHAHRPRNVFSLIGVRSQPYENTGEKTIAHCTLILFRHKCRAASTTSPDGCFYMRLGASLSGVVCAPRFAVGLTQIPLAGALRLEYKSQAPHRVGALTTDVRVRGSQDRRLVPGCSLCELLTRASVARPLGTTVCVRDDQPHAQRLALPSGHADRA